MSEKINDIYKKALLDLYKHGSLIYPSKGECKEIIGYKITIDDIADNVITLQGVKTNLDYAKEELQWYLHGTSSIDFSQRIHRIWLPFSDDGKNINSNYGVRIFGRHEKIKINQWQYIVNLLKRKGDSRRAVINVNSYFDKHETKDEPCTIALQFFIRNDKLQMIAYMRSNDIFKGFRNDLYCFTELQKMMASELSTRNGAYIHIAGSMHLYKEDYSKVEALL